MGTITGRNKKGKFPSIWAWACNRPLPFCRRTVRVLCHPCASLPYRGGLWCLWRTMFHAMSQSPFHWRLCNQPVGCVHTRNQQTPSSRCPSRNPETLALALPRLIVKIYVAMLRHTNRLHTLHSLFASTFRNKRSLHKIPHFM